MAVTVSTQGPFFTTGPISWSDLRTQFRAANIDGSFDNDTNPISASELYRDTTLTLTDPNVPDCTENRITGPSNNGVPESGAYAISRIRRAIKYYFLDQENTDTNLDLDNQNYNGNINRNIRKRFRIEGTLGSNDNTQAAGHFDATATNVRLEIRNTGRVLGASGPPGLIADGVGQPGGDALSLNSTGGNNNVVDIGATADVWGGGGGGDGGRNGTSTSRQLFTYGGSATFQIIVIGCPNNCRAIQICVNDGGRQSCLNNAPGDCIGCGGCQGGYGLPGCACGSCLGSRDVTVNTTGSDGVRGRGFDNQTASLIATDDTGGSAVRGGDGGNWGEDGNGPDNEADTGGDGGFAIGGAGANWTITGTQNTDTIKVNTF